MAAPAPVDLEPAAPANAEGATENTPEQQAAADAFFEQLEATVGAQPHTTETEPTEDQVSPDTARRLARGPLVYFNGDQTEDSEQKAWEAADTRLTSELNEGGKFKRFVKGIWKGSLLRGHYLVKYKDEALEQITDTQNIHAHDANGAQSAAARVATLERFTTTWTNEVIHTEIGESRAEHQKDSEFSLGIKTLVKKYVSGELNDESLKEEQNRFYAGYRQRHGSAATDQIGEGVVSINNMLEVAKAAAKEVDEMLEIAKAVKGSEEHAASIAYVVNNMRVMTGETRTGVRGKVDYGKFEKWLDNASKSKFGALVGPEAVTVAASLALGAVKMSFTKAVAVTGAVGVGAGVLGYFRERKRVKQERRQHSTEMAMGQDYAIGSKRREEMEATRYTTVEAIDLTNTINAHFDPNRLNNGGRGALEAAAAALAAAKTRVGMSDAEDINLISYSDKYAVERERLQLDVAIAAADLSLRERMANGGAELLGQAGATAESIVQAYSRTFVEQIKEDMTAKDKAAVSLSRRRGIKMGLAVGGASIVTSVGAHFAEQAILGGLDTIHHSPSGNFSHTTVGKGEVQINDDSSIAQHDGTIDIIGHDGKPVDGLTGLKVEQDGSLSQTAKDALVAHGMHVDDLPPTVETVQTAQTTTSTIGEYMTQPNNGTTHVTRDFWYDNNTPGVFEGNELGLDYGGVDNSGVAPDGHYQYVTAMYQGDSIHGDQVAQLQQLESAGQLKLAISASVDTQATPFMEDGHVVIQPDGSAQIVADIDPNSPAGSLYSVENGHLVYHGAYAEVVQVDGTDQNGVVHVKPLATEVGHKDATNVTHSAPPIQESHPVTRITTGGFDTTDHNEIVGAALPFVSRKSLEVVGKLRGAVPYGSYGEARPASERERRWQRDRSPELQQNPSAELNTAEQLTWYRDHVAESYGNEYMDLIQKNIAESGILDKIGDKTRAVVVMPVAAVAESENIFNTLSLYSQQGDGKEKTTILMNVNWIDDITAKEPDAQGKIDKTFAEIQRAREAFPDLNIAVSTRVWERSFIEARGGKLFGRVVKELYDTAAFAVEAKMRSGEIEPGREMMLITNDADARGMSSDYFNNYIRALDKNPTVDVFTSQIRWGVAEAKDFPGYMAAASFYSMTDMLSGRAEHRDGGSVSSCGANTGFRLSTFAACGGMDGEMGAGADADMGHRIRAARGVAVNGGSYGTSVSSGATGDLADGGRQVVMLTPGTALDTSPDRLLKAYLAGRSLSDAWNTYDNKDGYEIRTVGALKAEREDIKKDIKTVSERIARTVEGMTNDWYGGNAKATAAIRLLYGPPENYDIDRLPSGHIKFKFTKAGQKWLSSHLIDYGDRLHRAYYSSEKRPARFVSPIAA
jgi:hypothetical protein